MKMGKISVCLTTAIHLLLELYLSSNKITYIDNTNNTSDIYIVMQVTVDLINRYMYIFVNVCGFQIFYKSN